VFEKSKAETFQWVHLVFANLLSRASERFFLITVIAHWLTGQLLATVPNAEYLYHRRECDRTLVRGSLKERSRIG